MYCNKENVNILTALLVSHGIRHAVVCPGSRNAPIVHNLNECPEITCHAVTDERSAGFYALGMTQALNAPVAVCVTSGTALLNLMPAVAEAWYQHRPLVVISGDRPPEWIGQLDGQTLPQPGALGGFVRQTVTLPESNPWYCNRLVNEALLDATADDARPVHINVPIAEPLFHFDCPTLPQQRKIIRTVPSTDYSTLHSALTEGLANAQRPLIVFGQTSPYDFEGIGVDYLFSHVTVLHESLSPFPSVSHFDEVLRRGGIDTPDFIIHVGDTIVSKPLRHFLRQSTEATTWRISRSGDVEDTFLNLQGIVIGDAEFVLQSLSQKLRGHASLPGMAYRRQWLHALREASDHAATYQPPYSQMATVAEFERQLLLANAQPPCCHVHYANSTAIRLANIYAPHYVWCNRGVNGIEGSLSTAAGFSLVTDKRVFCVIGDLSFFYDQNALWNQSLSGNLRILLLNNGRGGIFDHLGGLEQSAAHHTLVAGMHDTTAEGICRQNKVDYSSAHNMEDMQRGIGRLLTTDAPHPMLLEVFTDATTDAQVLTNYYKQF